jgi:hypothetical protein
MSNSTNEAIISLGYPLWCVAIALRWSMLAAVVLVLPVILGIFAINAFVPPRWLCYGLIFVPPILWLAVPLV